MPQQDHIIPEVIISNRAAWYLGRFIRSYREQMGLSAAVAHRLISDIEINLVDGREATYWQRKAIAELRDFIQELSTGQSIWANLCTWIELRIDEVEPARDRSDRETLLTALSVTDRQWLGARRDCAIPYDQEDFESFCMALDSLQELIRVADAARLGALVDA